MLNGPFMTSQGIQKIRVKMKTKQRESFKPQPSRLSMDSQTAPNQEDEREIRITLMEVPNEIKRDSLVSKQSHQSRFSIASTDIRTPVSSSQRTSFTNDKRLSSSTGQQMSIYSEEKRSSLNDDFDVKSRKNYRRSVFTPNSVREDFDLFSDVIMEGIISEESASEEEDEDNEEPIQLVETVSPKKRRKKNKHQKKTDGTKFKTEMCKNWSETGKCNYGKKCQFAHGKNELMNRNDENNKYRSKQCKSFTTLDVFHKLKAQMCPYGIRCQFKHEQRSIEEIRQDYVYQKIVNNPASDTSIDVPIPDPHCGFVFRHESTCSLTRSYIPRSDILQRIEQKRIRSAERSPPSLVSFVSSRAVSLDKYLIQKWINQAQRGIIVQAVGTSSSEGHGTPNSGQFEETLCLSNLIE